LAYLQGNERASEVAAHIVDGWLAHGRNVAVVSVITAMDVSVQPMRSNNGAALQNVMDFLQSFPNLRLVPVDANCAFEAARMRAVANFASPDALIFACGLLENARAILTNDRTWKPKVQLISAQARVAYLEDFV